MLGLLKRLVAPAAAIVVFTGVASADTVPILNIGGGINGNLAASNILTVDSSGVLSGTGGLNAAVDPTSAGPISLDVAYSAAFPGGIQNPVTLKLSGFQEVGAASSLGGGSYIQNLTNGTFTVTDSGSNTVLAAGSVSNAYIFVAGGTAGSYLDGSILLDTTSRLGSVLATANLENPGSFAMQFSSVTFAGAEVNGSGQLGAFSGSGTAQFSATVAPLPATASMGFGLLGCLGGFGLLRRRRQLA